MLQSASSTVNGTTTVTDTITFDGYTESTITGGTTTTINYYSLNGQRVALRLGSNPVTYLVSDLLGSVDVAVNDDGSIAAVQLYWPYGNGEYSWGTMPTTYNFTGQRLDSVTGLLYYNARYYDPFSGRFTTADTVENNANGMDPYAYVGDDPVGKTDPSGHRYVDVVQDQPDSITANNFLSAVYGLFSSLVSYKIELLRTYAADPKNAESWIRTYVRDFTGERYVANRVESATNAADSLEILAERLSRFGYLALAAGAVLDGISSGSQYYQTHKGQGIGAAVAVGVDHAALSTAGSIIGADIGTDLGAALGATVGSAVPIVGTAIGGIIGAAVGGAVGGFVGGAVGDEVASSWAPAAAAVGSWIGSLF